MAIRLKLVLSLVCAGGLLLMLPHIAPAQAKNFKVDSKVDAPDASPGDGSCATASGACTLRAAVMEANGLAALRPGSRNKIRLRGGTYTLTRVGMGEDGAATGDLDVNGGALTINRVGAGTPIIDGNQADRIFHLGPVTPTRFSLRQVRIQDGKVVSSPPSLSGSGPDVGGGIRIERDSGLAVRNATFQDNQAGARGGAIGMPPSAATVAGADPAITTVLKKVTMIDNSAGVEAGAFFNNRVASLTKVTIKDNRVTGTLGNERGGGIAQSGDLTLTRVTVSGNSTAAGNGGGIANRGDPAASPAPIFGTLRLNKVTVSDNTAPQGGGIASGNRATSILTNATLSGNRASVGGGIVNAGSATLTNATLSGNFAGVGGGLVTLVGPPQAASSTASATLRNTILAHGATGGNCLLPPNPTPFARPPASGGDNISSDNSCNLAGPGDRNGVDPLLAPLADNGGFTSTHALLPGSPAIDAVLNNPCPPPATDQRGVSRPQGVRCDIGAYERDVDAG